jgi:predicted ATP-binding protein involved in virulence
MKINSIKIENLFEIFDYNISFGGNENVLIITGPNGFGKTMVLNIIFNLFNRNFLFFQKLVFKNIELCLNDDIRVLITKNGEDVKSVVGFLFSQGQEEIERVTFSEKSESDIERNIQKFLPFRAMGPDRWMDMRTQRVVTTEDLLNEYSNQLPDEFSKTLFRVKSERANKILDSIQVHLIREQRLFKKVQNTGKDYREEKQQTIMIETIQTYANELKQLIAQFSQQSFIQTQALDSSYPDRLINETNILSESEYKLRFNALKVKQEKLTEFGLYEAKQKFLAYNQDDSKALSVYLKDFETKLSVFDSLLEKLELFANILNERRFTFKTINISRDKGFFFKTSRNKDLNLSQLSSGEQHEVVLLYELIFNVKPNILVLIDEPEISLHITWQKEFLNDLLKIIKIQNIQVLIATHSPSIINDRWDLVYNLETVEVA